MGSKNRIAKELIPVITKHLKEDMYYVEPFCGGCNLINKIKHKKKIANDKDKYLIALLKHKQEHIEDFNIDYITKEEYLNVKQNPDNYPDWYVGFVGFIISFRGLFFSSYSDNHVIKKRTGRFEDYQKEHINNFMKDDLSDIEFHCEDYQDLTIPEHSLIYCDIPYKNTSGYDKKKNQFDYDRFYEWCGQKVKEGHILFVSEYEMNEDFIPIWEKVQTKNLGTKRQETVERLFVHKSQYDLLCQQ